MGASGVALLHILHPLEDLISLLPDAGGLLSAATPFQDVCVGFEGAGEIGGVGCWVVLGQGPVEVGGFLGGLESLVPLPVLGLTAGEVVEGHGEVGGVGGWVLSLQNSEEVGGFLCGFEGFIVSSGIGQASAE